MQVLFEGKPIHIIGTVPEVGTKAPNFMLVKTDFSNLELYDLIGKQVILNIFVSIDTPVCALSVRKFNEEVAKIPNTIALCISMDLPFAQKRFCGAEHLDTVIPVSAFRNREFGRNYGVTILEGMLKDLFSRAVVVIDAKGKVIHSEHVKEITHEPNYQAALESLKQK